MTELTEIRVPDIGNFADVPVIEILVEVGDQIRLEDPLVTLESDKTTMDIPAASAGIVREIVVAVGDQVSADSILLRVATENDAATTTDGDTPSAPPAEVAPMAVIEVPSAAVSPAGDNLPDAISGEPVDPATAQTADPRAPHTRPSPTAALTSEHRPHPLSSHATPAMRRYARELGADLARIKGTGRKGRVLREDINGFVKAALSAPPMAAEGRGIPPIPAVDFAKFGAIETRPLTRIKRISGAHLHRSWINIPHVTNHDEADVTELETFRQSLKEEALSRGIRLTLLAFVTKAVASTLAHYPNFNASLGPTADTLIIKQYIHIGIAVDTPNGLMVPVLRDADHKGVYDLAQEMADLGARARAGELKPAEMQGGTFSISSLGGIGGTAFTPIINAPEVAILGLSRSRMAPVWDGSQFEPRLLLPLDLSWDHRVVDGAEAARFLAHLTRLLGDVRRLLL